MSVLNRIPRGFLDLMGSITQGRNPSAYVDAVAPVVDISKLYLGNVLGAYGIDASHAAFGNSFSMDQGTDEVWLLRGLSARNISSASVAYYESWEVSLARPGVFAENNEVAGAAPIIWSTKKMLATAVGRGYSDAIVFDQPIVLMPGVNLTWRIMDRDAGGARTTELRAMLELLKA